MYIMLIKCRSRSQFFELSFLCRLCRFADAKIMEVCLSLYKLAAFSWKFCIQLRHSSECYMYVLDTCLILHVQDIFRHSSHFFFPPA